MFNLRESYFNDIKEKTLAAGQSISEEGSCLVFVPDGAGGLAVQECNAVQTELFAGFSITDATKILTETVVEHVTVPHAAPFTVQLKNANIITVPSDEAYVYDNTAPTVMTTSCPAPAAATNYCLTTSGLLTFHTGAKDHSVTITYRYTLTAAQVMEKFHQRSVNNTAQDFFSSVSVGCLDGQIFTSMFDASVAYVAGNPIYTGPMGKVTSDATSGQQVGICSKLPSVSDGMLGVLYKCAV